MAAYVAYNYFIEKPQTKSSWAWIIGIGLVIGGAFHAFNYFAMPPLTWDCWPVYIELLLFVAVTVGLTAGRLGGFEYASENSTWVCGMFSVLGGAVLALIALTYTNDFFHTTYQQKLLNVVDTVDVRKDSKGAAEVFSPIPVDKMKLLPKEVAMRKILNNMGDYKNTYEVSDLTLQSATVHCTIETVDGKKCRLDYDNQLIYVGILEHKFFWTWNENKYSPAYVLVDATTGDAYIITKVNDDDIRIRYTQGELGTTLGANFNYNLERHLRMNGYADVILDDFNFEIDENGRPFAPVTTMQNVVGMSTPDVTGVAVVDVQSGDINWYAPKDAPLFVNRIYPEWLIYERITNWGEYPNGYFHWDNNEGLLQPCAGMDIVQTKNGCCYYVGIQAKTGTFDTEGYMLIDIRTGEATYYKRDGISEAEAVRVLRTITYKGKDGDRDLSLSLKNDILYLTEPIFYNIEGKNTYFATFVANADLTVKYYAFCSADSKDVVGVGETLEEAKAAYVDSYHKHIAVKASKLQTTDKRTEMTLEAVVLEKVQEGNAYYFRLEGQEGKTFYAYSSLTPEVRWESNKIKITYNKTDANLIAISSYEALD